MDDSNLLNAQANTKHTFQDVLKINWLTALSIFFIQ